MNAPRQTITLHNDLAEIARLAEFVEAFCAPLQASDQDAMALQLALEEAVTNVINHGYPSGQIHTFSVALEADENGRVSAVVTDDAPAFDPLAQPPVSLSASLAEREIGGLGVHLVKKLMDRTHYERRDSQNILTMERRFRPSA